MRIVVAGASGEPGACVTPESLGAATVRCRARRTSSCRPTTGIAVSMFVTATYWPTARGLLRRDQGSVVRELDVQSRDRAWRVR
jgi:hypothetical protein